MNYLNFFKSLSKFAEQYSRSYIFLNLKTLPKGAQKYGIEFTILSVTLNIIYAGF
jgi:hypothetical protein